MIGDLFRWFAGTRVFSVDAGDKARVTNELMKRSVSFRAKRSKGSSFRFRVWGASVGACSAALDGAGIPYRAERYRGLPAVLRIAAGRPGAIVGAALFFACAFFSSRIVWDIRVSGNEKMSGAEIEEMLSSAGFTYGTYLPAVDFDALNSRVMAENADIAWISVNMRGTVAEVLVREAKHGERTRRDPGTYANLVAREDGRIREFRVDGGAPAASPGDVVRKGTLLVSGVIPLREGGIRYSYPSGEILAEVERSVTVRAGFSSVKKLYTGKEKTSAAIKIFKKTLNLFPNGGIDARSYDKIETVERIVLFGSIPLPVWVVRTREAEYTEVGASVSPEEAVASALSELRDRTDLLLADAELLKKRVSFSVDEDGVTVTSSLLVLTDISEIREFEVR